MPVLRSLQPVCLELKRFSNKYPELFFKVTLQYSCFCGSFNSHLINYRHLERVYFLNVVLHVLFKIDSEEWNKTQGQTILRTWEVESLHNYENNQDIKMVCQVFY